MNSFGRLFRISVYGESHGSVIGVIIDGVPPGIPIAPIDFEQDLQKRRPGKKGTTSRIEKDIPNILSGVFNNISTGAPVCIQFENANIESKDYDFIRQTPRPGHADFVASQKFKNFNDYRGGGAFSGRLTLGLVAAGVVAKKILSTFKFETEIISIAGEKNLEKGIEKAIIEKDSVGGVVECRVHNVPIGLGEPFFDSVESVLSHLIFSIPAIKGVEFGSGFKSSEMYGSKHNDVIMDESGKTATNHSGGINGGITNGNSLIIRIAVKPSSSTPKEQESFNFETGQLSTLEISGRHDLCIALRVPVVLESVISIGLCDLFLTHKAIFT